MKTSKLPIFIMLTFVMIFATTSLVLADVALDSSNFPDNDFRAFLSPYDANTNNILEDAEIANITSLSGNSGILNVANLKGVEYLYNVKEAILNGITTSPLDLSNNTLLEVLDLQNSNVVNIMLPNSVKTLSLQSSTISSYSNVSLTNLESIYAIETNIPNINFNALTELTSIQIHNVTNVNTDIDLSNSTNLQTLNISSCGLTSVKLPNSASNLKEIYLIDNKISSIDTSNCSNLETLFLPMNNLSQINISNNPKLMALNVAANKLTNLNVNNNTQLVNLDAQLNQIGSISLSNNTNLMEINLSNNKLQTLDVSNLNNLEGLYVTSNQLKTLKLNPNIYELYCGKNQLTTLDLASLNNLQALECAYNQFTSINLSLNPTDPFGFLYNGISSMPQKRVIYLDENFAGGKYAYKQASDVLLADIDPYLNPSKIVVDPQNYTDENGNPAILPGIRGTTLSTDKLSFTNIKDGTIVKYYYLIPLPKLDETLRSTRPNSLYGLVSKDSPTSMVGVWAIVLLQQNEFINYATEFEIEFKALKPTPVPTGAPTPTPAPTPTLPPIQAPQTGDNSHILTYAIILLMATLSFTILFKFKKAKK